MIILYFIIFILGLIIGSFLNVVIFRLESGEKIINDRSKCINCGHVLAWYDLFPVLSFIFLKGRCRYCGKKISWQYPLVEIATGMLFVLVLNFQFPISMEQGLQPDFVEFGLKPLLQFLIPVSFYLFITSSLIVIFAYDLKHYIIPDKIIYPAIGITFIYRMFEILKFNHLDLIGNWKLEIGNLITVFNPFIAAILAGAFFLSIALLTRGRGMGGGDVKLGFLMGLILGWPLVLIALFLSFILGSIVGIFLIFAGKKKMKSMIPFGPFLVFGTFMALFFGKGIVGWYVNLIIY